jgi:hypothetical protein
MAKAHDRIVEFTLALVAAADTLAVTGVNYYRDRGSLAAATPYAIKFSGGSAAVDPVEVALGELLPPPTHVRFSGFGAF